MPCFYLTPKQDDFDKIPELQVCIAEALYDVDSIVADPEAYIKDELASLHSQVLSNLEQAWELLGGSEDQLLSMMIAETGNIRGVQLANFFRGNRKYASCRAKSSGYSD